MTALTTERLLLRQLTRDDYPALCTILQDPLVMYAYEHAFSDAEARAWMDKQFARYRQYAFGLWAVVRQDNKDMIGQCGLSWQDADGEMLLEIGYLLRRDQWRRGYATEAALACKTYAFNLPDITEVSSIIRDTNHSSQRVAERLGMRPRKHFIKHYYGMDMPHIVYSVQKYGSR